MEENLDPDEYILKYGKDKFIDKINNPISIMDFKINFLKNKKDLTQTVDKAKYAKEVLEEVNKIDDEFLKEITLKKLSTETGLDIEFLKGKLTKKEIKKINKIIIKTDKYDKAQLGLLFYMLRNKDVVKMFESQAIYFPTKEYRLLYNEIKCFIDEKKYIDVADFMSYVDQSLIKILGLVETLNFKEEYDQSIVNDFIKAIKEKNIDDQYERLSKQLTLETDEDKKLEIAKKIFEIISRREENVE